MRRTRWDRSPQLTWSCHHWSNFSCQSVVSVSSRLICGSVLSPRSSLQQTTVILNPRIQRNITASHVFQRLWKPFWKEESVLKYLTHTLPQVALSVRETTLGHKKCKTLHLRSLFLIAEPMFRSLGLVWKDLQYWQWKPAIKWSEAWRCCQQGNWNLCLQSGLWSDSYQRFPSKHGMFALFAGLV